MNSSLHNPVTHSDLNGLNCIQSTSDAYMVKCGPIQTKFHPCYLQLLIQQVPVVSHPIYKYFITTLLQHVSADLSVPL